MQNPMEQQPTNLTTGQIKLRQRSTASDHALIDREQVLTQLVTTAASTQWSG